MVSIRKFRTVVLVCDRIEIFVHSFTYYVLRIRLTTSVQWSISGARQCRYAPHYHCR